MHKFSDFACSEGNLEGTKVPFADLFNKEIVIRNFRKIKSRVRDDKDCVQIQFSYTEDGDNFVAFTSSAVIISQLEEYSDELPFLTTICKKRRYYALS